MTRSHGCRTSTGSGSSFTDTPSPEPFGRKTTESRHAPEGDRTECRDDIADLWRPPATVSHLGVKRKQKSLTVPLGTVLAARTPRPVTTLINRNPSKTLATTGCGRVGRREPSEKSRQISTSTGTFVVGRADWIRTSDPLTPSQVRYQAAPQPDAVRFLGRQLDHHSGIRKRGRAPGEARTAMDASERPTRSIAFGLRLAEADDGRMPTDPSAAMPDRSPGGTPCRTPPPRDASP
jgi:hypothetical protein